MKITDKERIDWLQKHFGYALLDDDNGHWTICFSGFQNVVCGKKPQYVETTHWVDADEWSNSVRQAIDRAIKEERKK
jgi:hypothetical protein